MKQITKHIYFLLFFLLFINAIACSGGGSSESSLSEPIDPTPEFTPNSSESLADLVINTFTDNGIDITTDPEYIDFNDENGDIDKDDELIEKFTISNDSGQTIKINFTIYSVSSGFSVLDEDQQNLGSWSEIEIANGEDKSFYIQFNAWVFGTQTSYITIAADVDGYIRLPFRAKVSGAADFRVIPSGYFCSDEDAPDVDYLDFYKVSHGQTETHEIKLCNTGGEDITISKATLSNDDGALQSDAMDSNAFEEYLWSVSHEINSAFALGEAPTTTDSFTEPGFVDYDGILTNHAGHFSLNVHHSGEDVEDLLVEAGKLAHLDVNFSPELEEEAADGSLYSPISVNAKISLETSIGTMEIPLVGATSGMEPILEMSYRFSETESWREVDLNSDGSAIYFDTVEIFKDWVSTNSKTATIKIENTGTGTKDLEFYGGTLNGYFEYYWDDDEPITFPIVLPEGDSETFQIRYLPSASAALDDDFEANFNFGQFYFSHTGGNGPYNNLILLGEQDAGYATELYLGGSELKREYGEGQGKNVCVFSTDASNPTSKTFTVKNNNKLDTMNVTWTVSFDSSELSMPKSTDSFTVDPDSEANFTIEFTADSSMVGLSISATLTVETTYPDKESEYASELTDLEGRTFVVPLQATGSETGDSTLCGGGVLGDEDTLEVTFIMDRILMALPPSLTETNRNPPGFKFHMPMELNREKGTVRIRKNIEFVYDKDDPDFSAIKQIRSYVHQSTSTKGCAPLPTNPYRLEFHKGSWTGDGIECSTDEGVGTISFTGSEGTTTIDSDTACLDNNGAEAYSDTETGENWTVFYHDFVKFDVDQCSVQYYGKIATFAFKPDEETIFDVFERGAENPDESEAFYEALYGAYQYDSFITFLEDTSCGSQQMNAGETIYDPDDIKEFYLCLASEETSVRMDGFLNECSYFNFSIDEGVVPDDVDSANPDYDSWSGFGIYEPHVDDEVNTHETKYDLTIFNGHMRAIVIGAGDRTNFFGHPGHLVYSHIYATLTTKRVADEGSDEDGTWQDRIAVETRPHFDKDQVFLEDGNPYDIKTYWTEDGISEMFSNVIDDSSLDKGKDYGGFGRGNFKYIGSATDKIILSGWPINYDENNLLVLVALGTFTGKGNTAPSFAKADSTTGKGKALYFGFHGCVVVGDPEENQGCYDYQRDTATMLDDEDTLVIDEYVDAGILPNGYVDSADCSNLDDPGFENRYDYEYMPCINFKIFDIDRDRLTNYYDKSGRFEYDDNSYYNSSTCGAGM